MYSITLKQRQRNGFTLIEILAVLVIMGIVCAMALPTLSALTFSKKTTQNIYEVADLLRTARAVAMASNTYVWIGIEPQKRSGVDCLILVLFSANDGRAGDLVTGNFTRLSKSRVFENMSLKQFPSDVLQASGREAEGVDDLSKSTLSTSGTVPTFSIAGISTVFSKIIQFDPLGSASLKLTNSQWIEIGLEPAISGKATNYAILQISGLTGETHIFRP